MTPVGLAVAAVLWVAGGFKAVQYARRPDDRGIRLLIVFFAAMALTTTIWAAPAPFAAVLDPALGQNSPGVLRNVIPIAGFYAGVMFLLWAAGRDTPARRLWWLRVPMTLWALIALISWYSIPVAGRTGTLTDVSAPGHVAYFAVSLLGIGYSTTCLAAPLTGRLARAAPDRVTARGLAVAALGFALVLPFFTVTRLAALGVAAAGGTPPTALALVGTVTQLLALVLFVAGFGWPTLRATLAGLALWIRHYRLIGRMDPLWSALRDRFPEHDLGDDREELLPRRVHHRFYRRVVECRDGLVLAGRMAGPDVAPDGVRAEAALLRSVLARDPSGPVALGAPGWVFVLPAGDDVEDDARALAELAAELDRTPPPDPTRSTTTA